MKTTTKGATIGAFSGGLLAYYLTRNAPWATIKKVAAVVGGAAGGGVIGYGIAKIPAGQRSYSRVGGNYPAPQSTASIVQEAAYDFSAAPEPKARRSKPTSCQRPPDELRGDMLQWTELVQSGKPAWKGGHLQSSADAYRYFRDSQLSPQENFYVLMLNNAGIPLGHSLVTRGTTTETLINPADALRPAVLSGATRVIVAHNHPSGSPEPSPNDVAVTKRINEAGKALGITLLDHVVIGRNGYASLRDMGLFR
jgi:DNA repair protein RadC